MLVEHICLRFLRKKLIINDVVLTEEIAHKYFGDGAIIGKTQRYKGADMEATNYTRQFHLQPLQEIHLKSHYDYELRGNDNFKYLDFTAITGF